MHPLTADSTPVCFNRAKSPSSSFQPSSEEFLKSFLFLFSPVPSPLSGRIALLPSPPFQQRTSVFPVTWSTRRGSLVRLSPHRRRRCFLTTQLINHRDAERCPLFRRRRSVSLPLPSLFAECLLFNSSLRCLAVFPPPLCFRDQNRGLRWTSGSSRGPA